MSKRRIFLFVLIIVIATIAIAIWRVGRDRERWTTFIRDQARTALALDLQLQQPATVAWWPRIAIRLEGVRAVMLSGQRPVFDAQTVDVSVPWSALWSKDLRLGAVSVTAPVVHADAVGEWLAAWRGADAGPPVALRWPRLDSPLQIRDARWQDTDTANSWGPLTVELSALDLEHEVQVSGFLPWGQHSLKFELRGQPNNGHEGLVLQQVGLHLESDVAASSAVDGSGRVEYASPALWSAAFDLKAANWPAWLVPSPTATDGAVALRIEAASTEADGLSLTAIGSALGSKIDARLKLAQWPRQGTMPERIAQLVDQLRGQATLDRLSIDGVTLEGITLETDPTAAANATPTPTPTP